MDFAGIVGVPDVNRSAAQPLPHGATRRAIAGSPKAIDYRPALTGGGDDVTKGLTHGRTLPSVRSLATWVPRRRAVLARDEG